MAIDKWLVVQQREMLVDTIGSGLYTNRKYVNFPFFKGKKVNIMWNTVRSRQFSEIRRS